jgi:hypothetical protein
MNYPISKAGCPFRILAFLISLLSATTGYRSFGLAGPAPAAFGFAIAS